MIKIKSEREQKLIRAACRVVALAINKVSNFVKEGITTQELADIATEEIEKLGGKPAFRGYNGYPADICVSVNEEVVHGIPSKMKLKSGDIVSLDIGVELDGYFGDACVTVPLGEINPEAKKLIKVTKEALYKGIEKAVAGNRLSDISWAVQKCVEENSFSVVRQFVGHGIGSDIHEEPAVPNFGKPGKGVELKEGMVLAIEPMVNEGGSEIEIKDNGWTAVTKDRRLSCHFEHTVLISGNGPEILTVVK